MTDNNKTELATFAAGCFWGVEELFRTTPGVVETTVGYIGGDKKDPDYEHVCEGMKCHAEAVQIEFDPSKVSYEALLELFWNNHDPTTINRQELDVGEQYRSEIFYHTSEQKTAAEKSKAKVDTSGKWPSPVVTEIMPASTFYKAEEYHQEFLRKRGQKAC